MSRWPLVRLAAVCDINPKQNGAERLRPDALVSFVPMAAVDEVTGRIPGEETRLLHTVTKGYTPFRDNDVLFAKITPCMENGKAAIAHSLKNGVGFGSTEFHVLRPKVGLLPKWVFAFIRQPAFCDVAKANFTGTAGQQRVPAEFLKQTEIPLPPLAEQERIVALLDEAEALRRLRARADERTHDIAPALFDELFGDPAQSSNRWPIVPVSQFVRRFQAGRTVAPAGEQNSPSRHRILKVSAVTWGRFAPEESKPVPDSYEPTADQLVRTGDMLFSRANTRELVGATVLVEDTPDNLLLPDKLWRFVWDNPDTIEPRFVLSLFQHPSIRLELANRATGTGGSMKNISMDKVMAMEVPLPPLELQRAFAARVVEIGMLETVQSASRQRLDDLYQSLLHRAFQGEL